MLADMSISLQRPTWQVTRRLEPRHSRLVFPAAVLTFLLAFTSLLAAADTPGAVVSTTTSAEIHISWETPLMQGVPAAVRVRIRDLANLVPNYDATARREVMSIRVIAILGEDEPGTVLGNALRTRRWTSDGDTMEEGWFAVLHEDGWWTAHVTLTPVSSLKSLVVCRRGSWKDSALQTLTIAEVLPFDAEAVPETPARPVECGALLQEDNNTPCTEIVTHPAFLLSENRIGSQSFSLRDPSYDPEVFPGGRLDPTHVLDIGLKSFRLSLNNLDAEKIDWSVSDAAITPEQDRFIRSLAESGVRVVFNLSFWDKERATAGDDISIPRFTTESELDRYLEFVRTVVSRFRGVVDAYEIWNEPSGAGSIAWIEVQDYIRLAERATLLIQSLDPQAEVFVGGTHNLADPWSQKYLIEVIESGLMPRVDGLTWHGMYGVSPAFSEHSEYYYGYPDLVREIKDLAKRNGFRGKFISDELKWQTPDTQSPFEPWPNSYSEIVSAKYYARAIVMNLGLDVSTSLILLPGKAGWDSVIRNLCSVLADHESVRVPLTVEAESGPIAHCAFRFSTGDRMIAVWHDGVAQDVASAVGTTLRIDGLEAGSAVAVDVLNGTEQPLRFTTGAAGTTIQDLLLPDYPLLIRFRDVTLHSTYFEVPGDSLRTSEWQLAQAARLGLAESLTMQLLEYAFKNQPTSHRTTKPKRARKFFLW